MWEPIAAILVITMVNVFDPLRDVWMKSESWWKRHIVKWLAFYPPLAFITVMSLPWQFWLPCAFGSWIVWRASISIFTDAEWESMWIRWFKNLWK